jgi:hypothetical protein
VFQGEANFPPSPPIHTILPSGIAVIGVDSWVERFTKIFNNVLPGREVRPPDFTIDDMDNLETTKARYRYCDGL